jgi:hypothetical protein
VVHLASCPRLSSRKATVKETVALSRLPFVFRTDRSRNATGVPRTVPRPVCLNQLRGGCKALLWLRLASKATVQAGVVFMAWSSSVSV